MRRFLLGAGPLSRTLLALLAACALGWSSQALADAKLSAGVTETTLTGALLPLAHTNVSNTTLGFNTSQFCIGSGALIVCGGGITNAMLAGSIDLTTKVTGLLPIANGGTGTATPGLVQGTNVTITGSWPNQTINSTGGGGSGANPTATASDVAVNGVASTFMRSDGAPAVQKCSTSNFGLCKPDGTTISVSAGVISAVSGGAGTVTNNGNLTTHAPIIGGTNGTTDVKALPALTNGQFSVGVTGADPAAGSFGADFTNSSNVINLAQRTAHGDSAYTILSTDRYIVTSATLTAARVWTLPAASTLPAGTQYQVYDEFGGVSATNTIAIAPNGTDTINGVNNASSSTIGVAFGGYTLKSFSTGWTATANTVQQAYSCATHRFAVSQSATGVTTCTQPASSDLSDASSIAYLGVNQSFTKGQAVTPTTGGTQSAGGTLTPDFSLSNSVTATFGAGNLTIANPINVKAGQGYVVALTQDGVGSRTVTWGANFKWAGGTAPTLSTTAGAKDVISCFADTTTTINCTLSVKGAA